MNRVWLNRVWLNRVCYGYRVPLNYVCYGLRPLLLVICTLSVPYPICTHPILYHTLSYHTITHPPTGVYRANYRPLRGHTASLNCTWPDTGTWPYPGTGYMARYGYMAISWCSLQGHILTEYYQWRSLNVSYNALFRLIINVIGSRRLIMV